MFQAVIGVEQRGTLGQHYTSVPNIMKVIEPLFLNDLYEEYEKAGNNSKKLNALLNRIAKLKIFDPACGSGNFLIIAYKELRRLEIKIFQKLNIGIPFSAISLTQFYGIEIDAFAVEIAQLSLWLAEHQMNVEFFQAFGKTNPTLPLKQAGHIVCANACRIDWEEVCPKGKDDEIYILGNPPYLGSTQQNASQKNDLRYVMENKFLLRKYKNLDYVTNWFVLGALYSKESNTKFCFVSTNSICQGEQVSILWPHIFELGLEIFFARTSFKWSNNAKAKAAVICILVGLRNVANGKKFIYDGGNTFKVANINAYLATGKSTIVFKRRMPLSNIPAMTYGNKAVDGGNLFLTALEKDELLHKHNKASRYVKRILGSVEFLNDKERWCLWINDSELDDAMGIDDIGTRISAVRKMRLSSRDKGAQKLASKSHQFRDFFSAQNHAIIIPRVSSERRKYLVAGFLTNGEIISDRAQAIYDSEYYVFGLISSKMHMVWTNRITGRLKNDLNYSSALCYNTFPFSPISKARKEELTTCTFRILEEREKHPEKTLAQLYDPDKMPDGLREAHHLNDLAVERCYRSKPFESDEERLEYLFKLYEKMIQEEKDRDTLFQKEKKTRKKKKK